jgi:hypothetical protein
LAPIYIKCRGGDQKWKKPKKAYFLCEVWNFSMNYPCLTRGIISFNYVVIKIWIHCAMCKKIQWLFRFHPSCIPEHFHDRTFHKRFRLILIVSWSLLNVFERFKIVSKQKRSLNAQKLKWSEAVNNQKRFSKSFSIIV